MRSVARGWNVGVLALVAAIGLGERVVAQLPPPAAWKDADARTTRLPPSAFAELSAPLRAELERRGCTIPQTYAGRGPHNVVRGSLRSAGSQDVAVLCSRNRVSAILVFWAGDPASVATLAERPDATYLQVVMPGQIGFSRQITIATPKAIGARLAAADAASIAHDGLEDAFIEKGSSIWYWRDDRWQELPGSD